MRRTSDTKNELRTSKNFNPSPSKVFTTSAEFLSISKQRNCLKQNTDSTNFAKKNLQHLNSECAYFSNNPNYNSSTDNMQFSKIRSYSQQSLGSLTKSQHLSSGLQPPSNHLQVPDFLRSSVDSTKISFQSLRESGIFNDSKIIQSSSIQAKGFTQTTLYCSNKDGKKAKYKAVGQFQGSELLYCSKCAILLLKQGFQVTELNSAESPKDGGSKSMRPKVDYQSLLQRTKYLQGMIKKHAEGLQKKDCYLAIQDEKQRVGGIYDQLIRALKHLKNQEMEKLERSKNYVSNQIEKEKYTLFGLFSKLENAREQLELTVKNSKFNESEASTAEYLRMLGQAQNYEPLQFTIKKQSDSEKVKRILKQLQNLDVSDPVNFSFQNSAPEPHKKPGVVNRLANYYVGDCIQECNQSILSSASKEYSVLRSTS